MTIAYSSQVVTTEDAAPTSSPFKISQISGFTALRLQVVATSGVPEAIRMWMLRWRSGGVRSAGTRLASLGACCGISLCGDPTVMPLAIPSPLSYDKTINYVDLPSTADGAYDLQLYTATDTEPWA